MMKKALFLLASALFIFGMCPANAQVSMTGGPKFGGAVGKLFGDHQTFSADLEFKAADKSGKPLVMTGKMSLSSGKSRFEFDMAGMKGAGITPEAVAQMRAMGMDRMITITRPENKTVTMVYPGLKSYLEMSMPAAAATIASDDFKVEVTEIGKESFEGHPCVRNKVVVTGKDGKKYESLVWNATDMKNFPLKIETSEDGNKIAMLFKNISFNSPDAALFEAPVGYARYTSMQALMQEQMMKRMSGGGMDESDK
jgi:hypothetical protein